VIVRSSTLRHEVQKKSADDLDKIAFTSYMLGDDSDCVDGLAEAFLTLEPGSKLVCCRVQDVDWFFLGTEEEVLAKVQALPDCEDD
jgi:hypothetical protein